MIAALGVFFAMFGATGAQLTVSAITGLAREPTASVNNPNALGMAKGICLGLGVKD